MMIKFLGFSYKKGLYVQLVRKTIATWLFLCDVHIFLIYIKVFQNVLGEYLYIHKFNLIIFRAYSIYILHILWLCKLSKLISK